MASGAPDWQKVVNVVVGSMTAGAPDWERTVVGPGGTPVGGSSGWGVRLGQEVNQQTFASGAFAEVGFDTLIYQTRSVAPTFNSKTIGGHAYAYTEMVVPDAGFYDCQLVAQFNIVPAGLSYITTGAFIEDNGSPRSTSATPRVPTDASASSGLTVFTRDILQCAVSDVINFDITQSNSAGSTLGVSISPTATYALIRYLGTS